MSKQQTILTWMFYMLTAIRRRYDLSWDEFLSIEKKYHLSAFLFDQYELLHFYDNEYVIDDALQYIREQGGSPNELQRVG